MAIYVGNQLGKAASIGRCHVMKSKRIALVFMFILAMVLLKQGLLHAAQADYHHLHITTPVPTEGVKWYTKHMECDPLSDRPDAANCSGVELVFVPQPTIGSTQGTGVNHISFSLPDLTAKMAELEAAGVYGTGVRLQRYADGSTFRDVPGWFKAGFIFDPWGTRIELVEDRDHLGFHHIHLSATDPETTLAWYRDVLGGQPAARGSLAGLRFADIWVLASAHADGTPATTDGRAIDHIAFVVSDLDVAVEDMRRRGVEFRQEPMAPDNGRTSARRAFIMGPDNVKLAVVETTWAGVIPDRLPSAQTADRGETYDTPKTPWGEPDLQGIWTSNSAHGIPLERPRNLADVDNLTPEQAAARRERGTLGSIWGYEREWRDTTLGYVKSAPSTQVAMIFDPRDGRVPAKTDHGEALAARARKERARIRSRPPGGPEDLPLMERCITRGLPGMMMPGVYNNGLQIVQGPGFVTLQKEMVHETRIVPTTAREAVGENLKMWLGDPQGRWEGDTLVIETTNFNGRVPYRGSSEDMTLVERYTRIGPSVLEYQFTIDDPTVWTRPWTGQFTFEQDNGQYELVEYSCHEGNYGVPNTLSGARTRDKEAAEATR